MSNYRLLPSAVSPPCPPGTCGICWARVSDGEANKGDPRTLAASIGQGANNIKASAWGYSKRELTETTVFAADDVLFPGAGKAAPMHAPMEPEPENEEIGGLMGAMLSGG